MGSFTFMNQSDFESRVNFINKTTPHSIFISYLVPKVNIILHTDGQEGYEQGEIPKKVGHSFEIHI